jgi:hypothetical protein
MEEIDYSKLQPFEVEDWSNDPRIPLVCQGTHEAKQALMTDQQLADRFDAFELPAWRDDAALGQLLTSYASLLPLHRASELCAPKLRKLLLSLTEGVSVRFALVSCTQPTCDLLLEL